MNTSTARRTINVLGVLVLFVWVPYIAYFTVFPTLASVGEGILLVSGKAMGIAIAKDIIFTSCGIAGGIFLMKKKKVGRHITLSLAVIMLTIKALAIVTHRDGFIIWLITVYEVKVLPQHTLRTIHLDLFAQIVYILCTTLLLKKDISRQFDEWHLTTG